MPLHQPLPLLPNNPHHDQPDLTTPLWLRRSEDPQVWDMQYQPPCLEKALTKLSPPLAPPPPCPLFMLAQRKRKRSLIIPPNVLMSSSPRGVTKRMKSQSRSPLQESDRFVSPSSHDSPLVHTLVHTALHHICASSSATPNGTFLEEDVIDVKEVLSLTSQLRHPDCGPEATDPKSSCLME